MIKEKDPERICGRKPPEMFHHIFSTSSEVRQHKYQHVVRSAALSTEFLYILPTVTLLMTPLFSTLSPCSCHWGPPGSAAQGPWLHCWWRGPLLGPDPSLLASATPTPADTTEHCQLKQMFTIEVWRSKYTAGCFPSWWFTSCLTAI